MSAKTDITSKMLASRELPSVLISVLAGGAVAFMMRGSELVDPLLLWPILSALVFFGLRLTPHVTTTPLYAALSFILLPVLLAVDNFSPVSAKPQMLTLAFGTVTSGILLLKDFRYFWNFPFFRYISAFLVINILYLLIGYKTNFNLSHISAGYPVDFMTDTSDTGAGVIVFLSSYVIFIASVLGLGICRELDQPEKIRQLLSKLTGIFAISGTLLFVLIAIKRFAVMEPAQGSLLGLFVMLLLSFAFWQETRPKQDQPKPFRILGLKPSFLILLTMPLAALCLILGFNKTSLAGYALTLGLFLLLNQCFVPGVDFVQKTLAVLKSTEAKILGLGIILLLVLVGLSGGMLDLLIDKIDYFVNGFSSMSTMRIRTGNWHYFIIDWLDSLNLGKVLFGYGLGQSRETVFFISAMRQAGDRTLVQTVHDNYMEYFYDYGLLALVFYAATLLIIRDNLRHLFNAQANGTVKLFSILSLSCILFVGIYGLTDGIRVHVAMIYFAYLAMIEGLKHAIIRLQQANPDRAIEV